MWYKDVALPPLETNLLFDLEPHQTHTHSDNLQDNYVDYIEAMSVGERLHFVQEYLGFLEE